MLTVSTTTPVSPAAGSTPAPASPDKPTEQPLAGGGVQGAIGDLIRSSAAGYQAATHQEQVAADKIAIHPFETVATATGLLKDKTKNVKYVNQATSLLHTIGGFAMLILTSNVTSTLGSQGSTAVDLANRVADAIDGKDTAQGWSLGWGLRSPDGEKGEMPEMTGLGATLAANGVK